MTITYTDQAALAFIASVAWLFAVITFWPDRENDDARTEIPVQMSMVQKGILRSRPVDRTHEGMQEQATEVIWYDRNERKRP